MTSSIDNFRFVVKPISLENNETVELARPMKIHPLTYQELPYDPEYTNYADGRFTLEKLSNVTAEEMYWKARQKIILRHTGEHPFEISGPDSLKFLQKIFTRDISQIKNGRCSYQFACYHDGGMITDGLLLKIKDNKYWFAQGDGDLYSWYKAHAKDLNVTIKDPEIWVSQVQGPLSLKLLDKLLDIPLKGSFNYFDWKEVKIADQKVIISRTGFTYELGWEFYLCPENDAKKIGDKILEEGKKMGMILTASPGFRARRIEAGLLSSGRDFNKNTTPFSVGLGRFVDFKKGDFIGRDSLLTSNKNCLSWGIRVENSFALVGEKIKINGKNIGTVTSSTWSPFQVCGVGIVHLYNSDNGPGSVVEVLCSDGNIQKGEICNLPMYDKKGEIPRGQKISIPSKPEPWGGIKKN